MKTFTNLITFCLIVILLGSCAARAAYISRSERFSVSSSPFGESLTPSTSKLLNSSKESAVNSISNTTTKSGFLLGIYFTDIELGDKFEIQPEVDFLLVKDLNEIQAPILVKYDIVEKLSVLAGPNLGYLLDAPDGFKSFNFGIDLGAAYDITDKINVNTRYGFGLTNLLENTSGDASSKLSGFQIGLGYKF
ncbi:outer membrane beta-barrel protein [Tamlana sp. 2201CG12-4]|uniref:outer membrane beta-barrel protein n=1 Tax=Tamlana sp. 2201CG12-4 TaxID=3112582 RepID=UPI002DB7D024|nr:outer membrane beta-barrel protein [Tamlana sp. 2201CG12-4]MEC3908002.1 outer membrane beta-barrel protein [Tamlana sp. 2201CG12-4]